MAVTLPTTAYNIRGKNESDFIKPTSITLAWPSGTLKVYSLREKAGGGSVTSTTTILSMVVTERGAAPPSCREYVC